MKTIRLSLLSLFLLTIYSCIPSIHGIVTDETRITDDRLLGRWSTRHAGAEEVYDSLGQSEFSSEELDYTFERAANITCNYPDGVKTVFEGTALSLIKDDATYISKKELLPYYILTHRELVNQDTVISYFSVQMTKIQNYLWLDFLPFPQDEGIFAGHFATSYVLAHTFATVSFSEGSIDMRVIDADYIQKLITQKRIRLKNEQRSDNEIILTASTRELREFLSTYSEDENLLESPDHLYTVK